MGHFDISERRFFAFVIKNGFAGIYDNAKRIGTNVLNMLVTHANDRNGRVVIGLDSGSRVMGLQIDGSEYNNPTQLIYLYGLAGHRLVG